MIKYNYVNCEENESQYEDCDLSECNIVAARYVKAKASIDQGNPFIEALPYPRDEENVRSAYTKHLLDYEYDKVKGMTELEKMIAVGTLRQIRFPLTYHKQLEKEFYNALLTSYRARKMVPTKNKSLGYVLENEEQETNHVVYGNAADSTNAGFSLIGYSGCGKSSSIQTLLSHCPQVIIHKEDELTQYPQIVYLVVNCIPNSNFSALYESIGNAIDKALGNTSPVYAKEISDKRNLGKKAEKIQELIERFAIGIIIFDEIQLIDFSRTKENTFESLMVLSNQTKVAMAVVGTEDARAKMFKELRTTRRLGKLINGDMYCENKKFFSFLVQQLFQYQWFDEPVKPTNKMIDALYDVTKGIVDQLIGIYMAMCYDYLDRKTKPIINETYVYNIAQKYYPGMQEVLMHLESVDSTFNFIEIKRNAEERMMAIVDAARQEKEADSLISKQDEANCKVRLLKNVIRNISAIYDYSTDEIERAFHTIVKNKDVFSKNEKEITKMVVKKLESKDKPKKETKKKTAFPEIDTSKMQDFLG